MDDTKKMLRTIINNQSVMKGELIQKIEIQGKKTDTSIDELSKKIDLTNKRIDKLGKSLAYLEDDAPTREEFDDLENRVDGLEEKFAST